MQVYEEKRLRMTKYIRIDFKVTDNIILLNVKLEMIEAFKCLPFRRYMGHIQYSMLITQNIFKDRHT